MHGRDAPPPGPWSQGRLPGWSRHPAAEGGGTALRRDGGAIARTTGMEGGLRAGRARGGQRASRSIEGGRTIRLERRSDSKAYGCMCCSKGGGTLELSGRTWRSDGLGGGMGGACVLQRGMKGRPGYGTGARSLRN